MKTVSNIPVNSNGTESFDLLMEVNDWGVSHISFNKNPFKIIGISVYVFDDNDDTNEALVSIINNIQPNKDNIRQFHLFYNYKDSIIIPTAYNLEEQNKGIIELMYGTKEHCSTITEKTLMNDLLNTYRFSDSIHTLLNTNFRITTQRHSHSLQVGLDLNETGLYCIVFYDAIKIILHKNGKFQQIQQYQYTLPDDVLYHLLNTCLQYDVVPAETTLKLSGMIVKDSLLYKHLHHHFKQIDFAETEPEIFSNDEINKLPLHFFTHLTDLVKCV